VKPSGRSGLTLSFRSACASRHWQGSRATLRTGQTRYGDGQVLSVPAVRKDGARISVEFTIVPFINDAGQMIGIAAVMRDATARFEEPARLASSARRRRCSEQRRCPVVTAPPEWADGEQPDHKRNRVLMVRHDTGIGAPPISSKIFWRISSSEIGHVDDPIPVHRQRKCCLARIVSGGGAPASNSPCGAPIEFRSSPPQSREPAGSAVKRSRSLKQFTWTTARAPAAISETAAIKDTTAATD